MGVSGIAQRLVMRFGGRCGLIPLCVSYSGLFSGFETPGSACFATSTALLVFFAIEPRVEPMERAT